MSPVLTIELDTKYNKVNWSWLVAINDHIAYRMEKIKFAESPYATLVPQAKQARAGVENKNYVTPTPQVVKFWTTC